VCRYYTYSFCSVVKYQLYLYVIIEVLGSRAYELIIRMHSMRLSGSKSRRSDTAHPEGRAGRKMQKPNCTSYCNTSSVLYDVAQLTNENFVLYQSIRCLLFIVCRYFDTSSIVLLCESTDYSV
jgi:hypothetical protein